MTRPRSPPPNQSPTVARNHNDTNPAPYPVTPPIQPLQWASPREPGHLSPGGVRAATRSGFHDALPGRTPGATPLGVRRPVPPGTPPATTRTRARTPFPAHAPRRRPARGHFLRPHHRHFGASTSTGSQPPHRAGLAATPGKRKPAPPGGRCFCEGSLAAL
jgi:hypothetical protein